MREARIILPYVKDHRWAMGIVTDKLVKAFGGLTSYEGTGVWKGTIEDVRIVDIAYEPSQANDALLYDIAWQFREDAKQQEVYLRYGNGHVQMVTEKSCMDNGEFDWHRFQIEAKGWEDVERETTSDVEVDPNKHVEVFI